MTLTLLPGALANNVGLHMTPDHRYYFGAKGPLPSVTTILGVMDKPALIPWAKRTVAEFAVESFTNGDLAAHVAVGDAGKWLASLPDYQRDAAASVGTSVHLLADMASRGDEKALEGFEIAAGTQTYLDAFRGFLTRYSASSIVSSEKAVISFTDGYAGTYDLLMVIEDKLWLIDIKTSKGTYPETALQLAAYGAAEHIALPGDPTLYDMPKVERYGVLHLRPDKYPVEGWRLIEYGVGERDYVAFLAARELWGWRQEGRFKSL